MERLQKMLANAGVASRRSCEDLITSGRVTVNGRVVTELGTKVDAGVDVVSVDGRVIKDTQSRVYIMINKPPGYVSTTGDPHAQRTVLDLLPGPPQARLYPVGRLDADSEGLLLLTNDGALTERITHPRYGLQKEYEAVIEGTPTVDEMARLRAGIPLDGKSAPVDDVQFIPGGKGSSQPSVLRITVHEGRKHEIRRLCEAIGHPVRRLRRVRLGPLHLAGLATGASRALTGAELAELRRLTGLPAASGGPGSTRESRTKSPRQNRAGARSGRGHDDTRHTTADHNH